MADIGSFSLSFVLRSYLRFFLDELDEDETLLENLKPLPPRVLGFILTSLMDFLC